jgi:hypothetical protein
LGGVPASRFYPEEDNSDDDESAEAGICSYRQMMDRGHGICESARTVLESQNSARGGLEHNREFKSSKHSGERPECISKDVSRAAEIFRENKKRL